MYNIEGLTEEVSKRMKLGSDSLHFYFTVVRGQAHDEAPLPIAPYKEVSLPELRVLDLLLRRLYARTILVRLFVSLVLHFVYNVVGPCRRVRSFAGIDIPLLT